MSTHLFRRESKSKSPKLDYLSSPPLTNRFSHRSTPPPLKCCWWPPMARFTRLIMCSGFRICVRASDFAAVSPCLCAVCVCALVCWCKWALHWCWCLAAAVCLSIHIHSTLNLNGCVALGARAHWIQLRALQFCRSVLLFVFVAFAVFLAVFWYPLNWARGICFINDTCIYEH